MIAIRRVVTSATPRLLRSPGTGAQNAHCQWSLRCLASDASNESAASAAPTATAAAAASTLIAEPTRKELLIVALHSGIPMVGFGFMDNLVMIQAGEAIDLTIGVTFGLSTLTAAGFGQCFSDVAGFTTGGLVDAAVTKLNLPSHGLSQAQLGLKSARIYRTVGGCIGVVTGCLLGMCSLFFMDTDRAEKLKKAKQLSSIFETVMCGGNNLIKSERCTLWMFDREKDELWSKVATGVKGSDILRIPADTGVAGAAVKAGNIVNIHDAYSDDRFNREVDKHTGFRTRSVIAVPVKDEGGKVVGVIQMVNKKNEDGTDGVFDVNDAKLMTMLSSHVSTFIKIVTGHDD